MDDVELSRRMHVVRDGLRGAPPLLLVHGSAASGHFWGPLVPALAEQHRVICPDLPGHGRSAPAPSYGVPAQAARVAALLDEEGCGPVTAVGHSSGGYIVTALAERRPDLVRAIALVSSGPSLDALLPEPRLPRVLLAPPLGWFVWAVRTDAMIRQGLGSAFARPVDVPDELVASLRGIGYRAFRTVLRRNGDYIEERSVPDRLAALDVPLLVVFGAADRRWDPASAHRYEVVPGARVELLPGVGHTPMLEAPDATAELLLDFAARF